MTNKFKQHFKYASVSKETFRDIEPMLVEENSKMMNGLYEITIFFGWLLTILSCFNVLSRNALPAYLFLFLSSIAFKCIRKYFLPKTLKMNRVLSLLQGMALVVFGLLNSTVFSPDYDANGTIFTVLLLVFPFLVYEVPMIMDPILLMLTVIYCVFVYFFKAPHVFYLDMTNALFVCAIAFMCNWIFAAKNMNNLVNKFYIEKERDTDGLSGLLTKQACKTLIQSNLNRNISGALFVMDIDNFKKINDTLGHLYGDKILIELSNVIKENTRRVDVSSRFGGDEFVIFFPGMDENDAKDKVKKLFGSIKKKFKDETIPINCSVGISLTDKTAKYDELFKFADDALYISKNSGKARYTISRQNLEKEIS